MLVAELDRNLPSKSEKELERVHWAFRPAPINGENTGDSFEQHLSHQRGDPPEPETPPSEESPDYVLHLSNRSKR